MANTYKVLGQVAPAANTDTTLYTAPVSKGAVCSTLNICNRDTSSLTMSYRVAVVPSGQILSAKHYIAYDQFLAARGSVDKTIGITLAAGDMLVVRADSTLASFSLFGNEIDQV